MTFVMYMRNTSVILKMSHQKLIFFFPPTGVVFCALPTHHLFVGTSAGCRSAFDGIPRVCLPPLFCCLSCSQPEIAYQFKIKTKIIPKLPGETGPEA